LLGEVIPWEKIPLLPQGQPFWSRLAKSVQRR
jgi:hypothetical protein